MYDPRDKYWKVRFHGNFFPVKNVVLNYDFVNMRWDHILRTKLILNKYNYVVLFVLVDITIPQKPLGLQIFQVRKSDQFSR